MFPKVTQQAKLHQRLAELSKNFCDDLPNPALARKLTSAVAAHSPFLWQIARKDPARLHHLLQVDPNRELQTFLQQTFAEGEALDETDAMMRLLRRSRQHLALLVALADMAGTWSMSEATRALSDAAGLWIRLALRFLLRQYASQFGFAEGQDRESACGVTILAMGKLGARELNYSSDVDLIVLFDPQAPALAGLDSPTPLLVRLVKALVKLLQERTADGYVLRVDLRLRPDPGSMPIAISLPAAFEYYATLGQNWERAAMIKARPVAGDLDLGARFLNELTPFIWRKYFDYAAIADIHAMKRQIHAVRGFATIGIIGHDIKLGRGGIREIEFFVQTQQLIFGGRRPQLRGARTLDMLAGLQADGWITKKAERDLTQAYIFLRTIEHRLQMQNDEQTQRLPSEPRALNAFAQFAGFRDRAAFEKALLKHLQAVEYHYAHLFEHAPALDSEGGNLVFTGVADDPETLANLTSMGFRDAPAATEIIRGWHFGRRSAVQSSRAREVLTELVPGLLMACANSGDPDSALSNFDRTLNKMPAAVELLSLLKNNRQLLELYADILGGAPRLARAVALRPHSLDAAIDPALADASLTPERLSVIGLTTQGEEFLDCARDFTHEELFLIGLAQFVGQIDAETAAIRYSDLADALIGASLAQVERGMQADYGTVPGGRCAVLAMGRLGSREMTPSSDLDLIVIYDFDADHPESTGPKSLHAFTYYTRLTQRLVSALTVSTGRGGLYVVDLRLRPSGSKGPLATQLDSFLSYQKTEAETWEHMALTRARIVRGEASLCTALTRALHRTLRRARDDDALRNDVLAMRRLIAQEKGEDKAADLKLVAGGIVDIEFIAQYLVLAHAKAQPKLVGQSPLKVLQRAQQFGLLDANDAQALITAYRLYLTQTHLQRLTLDPGEAPETAGEGVRRRMAQAAGLPDFFQLEEEIRKCRKGVREIFNRLLR